MNQNWIRYTASCRWKYDCLSLIFRPVKKIGINWLKHCRQLSVSQVNLSKFGYYGNMSTTMHNVCNLLTILNVLWWSVYLSVYLFIHLSVCVCICPIICLSSQRWDVLLGRREVQSGAAATFIWTADMWATKSCHGSSKTYMTTQVDSLIPRLPTTWIVWFPDHWWLW